MRRDSGGIRMLRGTVNIVGFSRDGLASRGGRSDRAPRLHGRGSAGLVVALEVRPPPNAQRWSSVAANEEFR